MYYNKVILIGRLVREPENVMLPSGSQVSNLVLAYNRSYKDQSGQWKEESHFFEIKVFGKLAERVVPQLGKGDLILVEGRLHQDKWLDKTSGEPRSKIRIVAFDLRILSKAAAKPSTTPQTLAEEELPSFSDEDLLPTKERENVTEDLEDLIFSDEKDKQSEKKEKGEEKDSDILDNLDDLFL